MIVKILLCLIIPLLMLLGILEKRSRHLVLFLMIGSVTCLAACWINADIYRKAGISYFYLTTTVAPIVEETLKFIPIVLYALFRSRAKKQILPVAFAVGIGFAIAENVYALVQNAEDATLAWIIIRGIGTGLMHGMTTVVVGFGIFRASKDRRLIVIGTVSVLCLAIMYHGAYNCLISTEQTKYFGILLPIFTYGAILLIYYRNQIKKFFMVKPIEQVKKVKDHIKNKKNSEK